MMNDIQSRWFGLPWPPQWGKGTSFVKDCQCCSSAAQMYSLGGENGSAVIVTTADKSDMSAETTAAVTTANLTTALWELASVANPSVAAYYAGGRSTTGATDQSLADKLAFSNDTTAALTSVLSLARAQLYGAVGDRSTKGYMAGGLSGAGGTRLNTVDVITFSGDTIAAATSTLSQARSAIGGLTGTSTKGYWAGGSTGGGVPQVNTADKITFSSDAIAAQASAKLSAARFRLQTGSDGTTYGYWAGGQTGAPVSTLDKITFSTDTTAVVTSSTFIQDSGASASDGTKVVGLGGSKGASGLKVLFATDVVSAFGSGSAGNLSVSRTLLAGSSTTAL